MTMKTFMWVLAAAVAIVLVALAMHGHDAGLGDWLRQLHGR